MMQVLLLVESGHLPSVHSDEYRWFLGRLRQARKEAGKNQTEVARELKKPQSFVSKCESGERRVEAPDLAGIAHYCSHC